MLDDYVIGKSAVMLQALIRKSLKLRVEIFNSFGKFCSLFSRSAGYKTVGDVPVLPIVEPFDILCYAETFQCESVKRCEKKAGQQLRKFNAKHKS